MKMIRKCSFFLSLIAFFYLGACTTNTAEDQSSSELSQFLDDYFQDYLSRHPMMATRTGIKSNYDKLDDISDKATLHEINLLSEKLEEMKKFDFKSLSPEDQLSYKVFQHYANNQIEGKEFMFHNYPVNQFNGIQTSIPAFLIDYQSIKSEEDAQAYISRVKGVEQLMSQLINNLKKRAEVGVVAPQFVYDKVVNVCNNLLTGLPFDDSSQKSPIYNDFIIKLDNTNISQKKKNELISNMENALTNEFRNGYNSFLAYWAILENMTTENNGVWNIPNGKEYYLYALKRETTSDMTPEQIMELGKNEVALIQYEMEGIIKGLGFQESKLHDFFDYIQSNPSFIYSNDSVGKSAFLTRTKEVIVEVEERVDALFNNLPSAKLEVRQVEAFREKTANLAFSEPPTPDGSRPGVYYVNLHDMKLMPKYMLQALAYHEGIPGLHMQRSYVQENTQLPDFRKYLVKIEAYTEGWGLYSEFLPKQIGLYDDDYSDFGRLSLELFRACRLVVDVGIHYEGWSREKAIDYLVANVPLSKEDMTREVERYMVNPAQATAYYIGMNKIIQLRDLSNEKLGTEFDIKDFHDVILKHGALPLNILEENINNWINDKSETVNASL